MDSLTHFHSRNVYFNIHYSNNLKVTALDRFKQEESLKKTTIALEGINKHYNLSLYLKSSTGFKDCRVWIAGNNELWPMGEMYIIVTC